MTIDELRVVTYHLRELRAKAQRVRNANPKSAIAQIALERVDSLLQDSYELEKARYLREKARYLREKARCRRARRS